MSLPGESGGEEDTQVMDRGPGGEGKLTKAGVMDAQLQDRGAKPGRGEVPMEVHKLHLGWV
jgi:hypothetical protein